MKPRYKPQPSGPVTYLWFMAYPPVEEENPTWRADEHYVFKTGGLAEAAARLPELAILATESAGGPRHPAGPASAAHIRSQLITSMLRQHQPFLLPAEMFGAFTLHPVSPRSHDDRAKEVRELARRHPDANVVIALPPPTLQGIFTSLGHRPLEKVTPLSIHRARYQHTTGKMDFVIQVTAKPNGAAVSASPPAGGSRSSSARPSPSPRPSGR